MNGRIAEDTMLSFVCPIHNAETQLEAFGERLKLMADEMGASYEIIFVNDGSTDETMTVLRSLAKRDGAVRYLDLSRQFGPAAALVAGCDHATGQAIVTIGIDQSPDRVPTLIERWHGGWEIVHGSAADDPVGLRLMDHKAARALCQWHDRVLSVEQVLKEIGFRQTSVLNPTDTKPHRSIVATWRQSLQGFAASTRWLGGIGVGLLVATVAYLIVGGVLALLGVADVSIVLATLVLIAAVQALCVAAIGECFRTAAARTERRPSYVIRHRHGFGDGEPEAPERPAAQEAVASRFTVLT